MNEILGPFLHLHPPSQGTELSLKLYDAFLLRYAERFVCRDDDISLFNSFRLFHLLLLYHDPQLAIHLQLQGFPPELYSPQWFLTLFARSLPVEDVLRFWDLLISWDDPAITFCCGICLLRRRRPGLLASDTDNIPEILRDLHLHDDKEVDSVVSEAVILYKNTPRCFVRCMRLCCVSSTELTPLPTHLRVHTHDEVNEKTLEAQVVRQTVMMTAMELVSYLVPLSARTDSEDSISNMHQFVVIDLRAWGDIEASGGGSIPRAVHIEPDFLSAPDALDKWLDHFDGCRGSNIVIIDLPPMLASPSALWRRLLLGEGDGVSPSAALYSGFSGFKNAASLVSMFSAAAPKTLSPHKHRDDIKYTEVEKSAILDDTTRPAVELAKALQRNNFNLVSVLEGGYPALVEQLLLSRGEVEPVIVDFNMDVWTRFLHSTGRNKDLEIKTNLSAESLRKSRVPLRMSDFSEEQRMMIGLQVARRLGHSHTEGVLMAKLLVRGINIDPSTLAVEEGQLGN
jgi:hypothetical protein